LKREYPAGVSKRTNILEWIELILYIQGANGKCPSVLFRRDEFQWGCCSALRFRMPSQVFVLIDGGLYIIINE